MSFNSLKDIHRIEIKQARAKEFFETVGDKELEAGTLMYDTPLFTTDTIKKIKALAGAMPKRSKSHKYFILKPNPKARAIMLRQRLPIYKPSTVKF